MSHNLSNAIAVIGIDIGKNSFHIVGLDARRALHPLVRRSGTDSMRFWAFPIGRLPLRRSNAVVGRFGGMLVPAATKGVSHRPFATVTRSRPSPPSPGPRIRYGLSEIRKSNIWAGRRMSYLETQ